MMMFVVGLLLIGVATVLRRTWRGSWQVIP
jgi:hypothetical protein